MTINKQSKREAKQLFGFCRPAGILDESRVRQVVQHITATGYRKSPAVLAHFLRLVRIDRLQHTATVETAVPLSEDLWAATEASLANLYGPGLITSFTENPSLIGGMRIQVGSDVYDGSVLGRLKALEKSF
jgi:F-type H+-transporting ATPase subunit delta